ncbi:hypothetical protein H9P43_003827 [Blastocladiella emersonii ATCC 22665]|nr:hypothetical protein H9P43_003827 [Blastocladiella emersonii ATCC 22665]
MHRAAGLTTGLLRIAAPRKSASTDATPAAGVLAEGRSIRGCVFDMDGTLTVPVLDFALMKQRLGLQAHHDIVKEVYAMPEPDRSVAQAIIVEMEREAMEAMTMARGFHGVMRALEAARVPKAILTRNNMEPVEHLLTHHAPDYAFHPVVTRDTVQPTKPHADPLLHIAQIWGVPAHELVMVGDGEDDVLCARAAGAVSVFVHTSMNGHLKGRVHADFEIHELGELHALLSLPRVDGEEDGHGVN